MLITKIEQQKKNLHRYNIYLNDQFWLGIDEDVLVEFRLIQGKEITDKEKVIIQEAENFHHGYRKALNYISHGLKSSLEVEQYLLKHLEGDEDHLDHDIKKIIRRLMEQGYLNDQLYAEAFVRTTALINRKGPGYIRQALRRKGIKADQIELALSEYPESQRLDNLEIMAEKYVKSQKNIAHKKLEQKLRLYLMQNGFSDEEMSQVSFGEMLSQDVELEWELLDKEAQKQLRIKSKKFSSFALKQKVFQSLIQKGFESEAINLWFEENKSSLEGGSE